MAKRLSIATHQIFKDPKNELPSTYVDNLLY
jgi:hypothetical protein